MNIQDFLKMAGDKIGQTVNPPTPYELGPGTIAASQIPAIPPGVGVHGLLPILSQLARGMGNVQVQRYLDSIQRQQTGIKNDQAQQRLDMDQSRLGMDQGNYNSEDAYRKAQVDNMKADNQRADNLAKRPTIEHTGTPLTGEDINAISYGPDGTPNINNLKHSDPMKVPAVKNPGKLTVDVPHGGDPRFPGIGEGHQVEAYYNEDAPDKITSYNDKGVPADQRTARPEPLDKAIQDVMKTTGASYSDAYRTVTGSRGDVAAGRQQVVSAYKDLKEAGDRLKAMQDAATQIASGKSKNPGTNDMVLLSNHIGMTFGSVKGARTGKDLIEAHIAARSLPARYEAMYNSLVNGQQLAAEQRQEMLNSATDRYKQLLEDYNQAKSIWDYTPPGGDPKSMLPSEAPAAPVGPYAGGTIRRPN